MGTWQLCPRRWGFVYLEGKREPQHPSAAAGTKVHDLLEKYLRDGVIPDRKAEWNGYKIGEIAYDMLQHLPPRGSVQNVETELALTVDGVKYRGRVDALTDDCVYDHKTAAQLKYAKTEDQLENDLQALLYARWQDKDVKLQWTTGQTRGATKSKKVVLNVLRDEVLERFDRIVTPLAKEVLAAYEKNDVKSLAKNKDACRLYPPKGCPFQRECWSEKTMSIRDRLLKKIEAAQGAPAQSVPTPESAVQEVPNNQVEPERAAAVAADIKAIAEMQAVDPINPPLLTSAGLPPKVEAVAETLPKKPRKSRAKAEEKFDTDGAVHNLVPAKLVEKSEISLEDMKTDPAPAPETKPIRTLFCDCTPLGDNVIYAHTLIAKAAETVCNDLQVPHVKLLQFGAGGPSLAAQLRADLLNMAPGFDLVLITRTPEGRDCQQELMSLAEKVVMGF